MTKENLVKELQHSDTILPAVILRDMTSEQTAVVLAEVFKTYKQELLHNRKFRDNFTELVNYIYLLNLNKEPTKRKKNLFSTSLTSFLLNPQSV